LRACFQALYSVVTTDPEDLAMRGGVASAGTHNNGVYFFAQQNTTFTVSRRSCWSVKMLYNTFSTGVLPRTPLGAHSDSPDLLAALRKERKRA